MMAQTQESTGQVWTGQARKLRVGDSVRFRVPANGYTEGIVLEVLPEGQVRVLWDGNRQVSVVHGASLVALEREPSRGRA